MSFVIFQINLDYAESYLYDLRIRFRLSSPQPEHVELVFIRPPAILKYKGMPDAKTQNEVLAKILEQKPAAVVYDFDLNSTPGDIESKNMWEENIVSHTNVFASTPNTPMKGEESQLFLRDPLEKVKTVPSPKTADTLNLAKDRVSRRMMLTYQNAPMLQVQVASFFNPEILNPKKVRGHFEFYDTDQSYVDYSRTGAFPASNFEDLQSKSIPSGKFTNKVVLIGTDLELEESEYVSTPFSRKPSAMTRTEFHANVIETLIRNSGPLKAPPFINWVLVSLVALLTVHIVLTSKPAQGLVILVATFGGLLLIAYIAFSFFGIWISIAHPLLAIFLCYYFFIPYRLIVENRRSWEYYQKNKLLSQVEELKSNFISMMSHDLKTPIARIQGMSDVILSDSNHLSSQQREAVDTIKHSSDDLLKFINAILNYGRIESQGVQLHLQSKDVNSLLKEVIRKHEFLAKLKRIQIVSELEPLFPISVDPELMKQVLSNLVENAIKYSPEDTKILVSSEERDSKVVIQVADQGPGIPPDELNNIFMKFFRSKNAKSSPIKGSGLGLYLAKYFTELHKGDIFVESSIGNGSTFTVELPIEQGGLNA
ncbi:ATP-binding protein [Bdellovibrio sp. HCB2-146]|uniref:ATP-binding protein n=1 Tax=Bdellovibrio sp. HCB2-146 TaxID=3394362 RepID=UPI0039BD2BC0